MIYIQNHKSIKFATNNKKQEKFFYSTKNLQASKEGKK